MAGRWQDGKNKALQQLREKEKEELEEKKKVRKISVFILNFYFGAGVMKMLAYYRPLDHLWGIDFKHKI